MRRLCSKQLLAFFVLSAASVGLAHADNATFDAPSFGGAALLKDGTTLIIAIPTKGTLLYLDTSADKELKSVEVEFAPHALAVQGDKLFAAAKGSSVIHVLEATTGKETKTIKLQGEPVRSLACHPEKGLLYATNQANEVFSIDTEKGSATKTSAKGQSLVVDPVNGKFVYTGIQNPIEDQLVFEEGPDGKVTLTFQEANLHAFMLKYSVDGDSLKSAAVNDNAAINGRSMSLSPDGKMIAMAGGGGWRSKTDPRANYSIAVFDASDMKTMLGQVELGAYPAGITFHPVLKLGAAYRDGAEVVLFNSKSFAKKDSYKMLTGGQPPFLMFAGKGTKLVYASFGSLSSPTKIEIITLPLTDSEKAELEKANSK